MTVEKKVWGTISGVDIFLFTLKNSNGIAVSISNYGALISSLIVPDKTGDKKNIVLSYDTLDEYVADEFYLGCTLGRVANRISNARFMIDGKLYRLALNEPSNNCHLHGGNTGFNKKVFEVVEITTEDECALLRLSYTSCDMEEGYPGNVTVVITYSLNEANEFLIDYSATTDAATHVNITNHSYFNLTGKKEKVFSHHLYINADQYVENDSCYLPTGKLIDVAGTPNDFRTSRLIKKSCTSRDQLYNECYVLNNPGLATYSAELFDPCSERRMKMFTTFPGIVLYSGFGLNGRFLPGEGVCLESQFFPDAPNQPAFSGTLLLPGEQWHHQTKYVFMW